MNDDELRARLQAADPAASLPPADPDRTARLLEDTMSDDLDTAHQPDAGTRRRSPLTWLAAAAAAVVIAGAGAFALVGGDDDPVPVAKDRAPSVMQLSAPPAAAAKCAAVSVELLSGMETAFDGTVASITDDLVTLDVSQWYRGGDADQVTVQAPPSDMEMLVQAADFQVGQRYLVSANEGFVTVCSFTAAYSEELAAMYAQAFGG